MLKEVLHNLPTGAIAVAASASAATLSLAAQGLREWIEAYRDAADGDLTTTQFLDAVEEFTLTKEVQTLESCSAFAKLESAPVGTPLLALAYDRSAS